MGNNKPPEDYDTFVENMTERSVAAFAEVRRTLQRSAERNKRVDANVSKKFFDGPRGGR